MNITDRTAYKGDFLRQVHPNVVRTVIQDILNGKLTPFEQLSFLRTCKTLNALVLHWQIFTKEYRQVISNLTTLNPPIKIYFDDAPMIRLFAIAKVNNSSLPMCVSSKIDTKIETSILIECIKFCTGHKKQNYVDQLQNLIENERVPYTKLDCRCLSAKILVEHDPKLGYKNFKFAYEAIKKRPVNLVNRDEIGDKLYLLAKAIILIKPKKACNVICRMTNKHDKAVKALLLAAKNLKSKKFSFLYLQEAINIVQKQESVKNNCRIIKAFRFLPQTPKFKECANVFTTRMIDLLNTKYQQNFEFKILILCELYDFYAFRNDKLTMVVLKHITELFNISLTHFNVPIKREICFVAATFFSRINTELYFNCLSAIYCRVIKIKDPYEAATVSIALFQKFVPLITSFENSEEVGYYFMPLHLNIISKMNLIDERKDFIDCLVLNFFKFMPAYEIA